MGQKVHPTGIRLGITKDHNSVWYAGKDKYADQLLTDIEVRSLIEKRLEKASVSKVVIERPAQTAKITIHTARPGIVIGKKGEDVDRLRKDVADMMGIPVHLNIEEIRKPDLDAKLVGQSVASQLERRVMFRRAMKRAVQNAMRLRADIDYATYEAHTTYGVIGIKVWIFKGEILGGIDEVRARAKSGGAKKQRQAK